jgi:Tfp pilus assembly protein PilN
MLKINLLPPYINQASRIRTAWVGMALVLVAELAGLSYFQWTQRSSQDQLLSDVQGKEQRVQQVQKLKADAEALRAKIKPIKDKTDFINQLFDFNKVRPDLYEHVASYIYREVWISGMSADQNILTMPASAKSISAVGRFLLFMQNNPDFTQVRVSSVPGWPPGTSGVEAGPLSAPGGAPGGPAGSGGPPGAGYGSGGGPPGGSGGPPGGPPVMGSGGGPPGGAPPGGPPGGSGGGPPGFGGAQSLAPPIFGAGGEGGGPGLMSVPTPGQPGNGGVSSGGAPIPYPGPAEAAARLLRVYCDRDPREADRPADLPGDGAGHRHGSLRRRGAGRQWGALHERRAGRQRRSLHEWGTGRQRRPV